MTRPTDSSVLLEVFFSGWNESSVSSHSLVSSHPSGTVVVVSVLYCSDSSEFDEAHAAFKIDFTSALSASRLF